MYSPITENTLIQGNLLYIYIYNIDKEIILNIIYFKIL